MAKFVAEPFTNEFGQIINPGDPVLYVGTAWKSSSVRRGVYAGVYKGNDYSYNRETRKYDSTYKIKAVKVTGVPTTKYDKEWNAYSAERCAILPLMRVYRLDTTMLNLEGKSF